MRNRTIYDLLIAIEGDPLPDYGREDTELTIDNWEELIRQMITRLKITARLSTGSEEMNASAEAAKKSLISIKEMLDTVVSEHENSGW